MKKFGEGKVEDNGEGEQGDSVRERGREREKREREREREQRCVYDHSTPHCTSK